MNKIVINLQDADALKRLKNLAEKHNVSPEQEAESLLLRALQTVFYRRELADRARAIAELTPKDVEQTSSERLVAEDRSRCH